MRIIGAGLAGLLAGNLFQRATLYESGPEEQISHRAVLRFRSSAVGDAVGVEFRPVTVYKGIWNGNTFAAPNIELANLYSQKVIGRLADRSIWNVDPAQRWIAPENLVEQMAERCRGRIHWNTQLTEITDTKQETISTIPLPAAARMLNARDMPQFEFAPIIVRRWRIVNADVFQTIYFPSPSTNLYRATITGSLLVAEFINDAQQEDEEEMFAAFGISDSIDSIDSHRQRFGKIVPINDAWRRQFILHATLQHRIYSLGRFATWRNILLDDVLHDVAVIKRLIAGGAYAATRQI
jgi:hypothetical protein